MNCSACKRTRFKEKVEPCAVAQRGPVAFSKQANPLTSSSPYGRPVARPANRAAPDRLEHLHREPRDKPQPAGHDDRDPNEIVCRHPNITHVVTSVRSTFRMNLDAVAAG